MKKNDYLFAVASVRALENSLLKQSDLEQLINAEDYQKAVAILNEKGYDITSTNYSAALDGELEKTWALVNEAAPEAEALEIFIIKNDFQNLKAILKSEVMSYNAEDYFVKPCVFDSDKLLKAVGERRFEELPEWLGTAAEKAYEVLAKTGNGQLCDAIIDTAALETIVKLALDSGDEILGEFAELYCLCADIKTAYRAVKTNKSKTFLEYAIADTSLLKKDELINAAGGGIDEFSDYLSNTGLTSYRAELEKSGSAFEKYCDDRMLETIKKAKMTAFGVSPLAAYFVAKETEIKCLRIILSAKLSFVSGEKIRERMRELYV